MKTSLFLTHLHMARNNTVRKHSDQPLRREMFAGEITIDSHTLYVSLPTTKSWRLSHFDGFLWQKMSCPQTHGYVVLQARGCVVNPPFLGLGGNKEKDI
jgi:hypothetical protein